MPDTSIASAAPTALSVDEPTVDLERRREQLQAQVAELQWDLGGLVYEIPQAQHGAHLSHPDHFAALARLVLERAGDGAA